MKVQTIKTQQHNGKFIFYLTSIPTSLLNEHVYFTYNQKLFLAHDYLEVLKLSAVGYDRQDEEIKAKEVRNRINKIVNRTNKFILGEAYITQSHALKTLSKLSIDMNNILEITSNTDFLVTEDIDEMVSILLTNRDNWEVPVSIVP